MNKTRRKQIIKAIEMLNTANDFIESIRSDEEDYMNNIPENLQNSDRYYIADEAVSNLEDAISDIESAIENLENASI